MNSNPLINILILAALILVQVLACNHIVLFNVAIAFIFIYIILRLPMNLNINWVLTWGFAAGLLVDIFSDTLGVNALACTILAMLRRPMLYAYIPKDDRTKNIMPSLKSLGFSVYGKYLLTMAVIYCFLVFTIEFFNFANIREIVIMASSSAAFTFLIILGLDSLIGTNREKGL